MLYGNPNNELFRILAIDPGTNTLGISIFDIDIPNKQIYLIHAYTFEASKWIDTLIDHTQWQGMDEKYLRLHRHEENLFGLLNYYQPHLMVHESAFMGKFPKAYQGLTECLCALRQAAYRYSPYLLVEGITPMEVKYYIGGVKKDEVLKALHRIQDIHYLNNYLPYLDEHAIDSIAIGYTKAKQLLALF